MNINLNLSGNLSQQQQLNLAPQLLQWLRLLQVPAQSLEQLVRGELETNPALEQDDGASDDLLDERSSETDDILAASGEDTGEWPELDERFSILAELDSQWAHEAKAQGGADVQGDQERYAYQMQSITADVTISDLLLKQIAVCGEPDDRKQLAALLIGCIDARGYIEEDLTNLAELWNANLSDVESALSLVQSCDPVGVGARDLQECLLLQLQESGDVEAHARILVREYLPALAQGRIDSIAQHMQISREAVIAAQQRIRALDPAPGKRVADGQPVQTVTPDIIIKLNPDGGFDVSVVDESLPRLRISRYCRRLIEKGNLTPTEVRYVRSRIRAASFLIDGIEKRGTTLRRIADEIVRVQHQFLRGQELDIRPLTMAKVAGIIGVHDTTVSRALADKYVLTPVGLLPMKSFFCTGYRCDDGSAMTPDMVKRRIEAVIGEESPLAPVKDDDIAATLKEEGIPVARRTVAKYRVELGIASSKDRAKGNKPLRVLDGGQDKLESDAPAVAMMG